MSSASQRLNGRKLNPEKVAYWYFRLNGFFQIENFYVHPSIRGGARTDADLLAIRFPYRAEGLFENPPRIMSDDVYNLALNSDRIDVVITEITRQKCKLNGPWTNPEKRNVNRVLAAIGCIPPEHIAEAADAVYQTGFFEYQESLRLRLVAIGNERCNKIAVESPRVTQVIWSDLLRFVCQRLQNYRHQKAETQHWDPTGHRLKRLVADVRGREDDFIEQSWELIKAWQSSGSDNRGENFPS